MIFSQKQPDPFTLEMYQVILEQSPPDYMEYNEQLSLADLYFVNGADLSTDLFESHTLRLHYSNQ